MIFDWIEVLSRPPTTSLFARHRLTPRLRTTSQPRSDRRLTPIASGPGRGTHHVDRQPGSVSRTVGKAQLSVAIAPAGSDDRSEDGSGAIASTNRRLRRSTANEVHAYSSTIVGMISSPPATPLIAVTTPMPVPATTAATARRHARQAQASERTEVAGDQSAPNQHEKDRHVPVQRRRAHPAGPRGPQSRPDEPGHQQVQHDIAAVGKPGRLCGPASTMRPQLWMQHITPSGPARPSVHRLATSRPSNGTLRCAAHEHRRRRPDMFTGRRSEKGSSW